MARDLSRYRRIIMSGKVWVFDYNKFDLFKKSDGAFFHTKGCMTNDIELVDKMVRELNQKGE